MKRTLSTVAAACLAVGMGTAAAAPVLWSSGSGGNDHWYDYVFSEGGVAWEVARANSLASTHLGLQGYLATVTSDNENLFLDQFVAPGGFRGGWLGGSDAAIEGEWRWADGPEAGILFWLGGSSGSTTTYAAWGGGWPNTADYLEYRNPSWASVGSEATLRSYYYVEYSAASTPPGTVPLPGTLSLVGLALLGLPLARRKGG